MQRAESLSYHSPMAVKKTRSQASLAAKMIVKALQNRHEKIASCQTPEGIWLWRDDDPPSRGRFDTTTHRGSDDGGSAVAGGGAGCIVACVSENFTEKRWSDQDSWVVEGVG